MAFLKCPHCNAELASSQRGKHCESPACVWLLCACGATVLPSNGNAIHSSHLRVACTNPLSPCQLTD